MQWPLSWLVIDQSIHRSYMANCDHKCFLPICLVWTQLLHCHQLSFPQFGKISLQIGPQSILDGEYCSSTCNWVFARLVLMTQFMQMYCFQAPLYGHLVITLHVFFFHWLRSFCLSCVNVSFAIILVKFMAVAYLVKKYLFYKHQYLYFALLVIIKRLKCCLLL